jgi:hypothetical protein
MTKLITKTLERAGKGQIISGDIISEIQVCRLAGRGSYTVLIDGSTNGISRATAGEMWQFVIDYFNVWTIEEPPKVEKKTKLKKIDKKSCK